MSEPGRQPDYVEQLGRVLRRRDPEALRRFLEESAARYGDAAQVDAVRRRSGQEVEILLHRMILARRDLADLHEESRAWLASRGLSGPELPSDRDQQSDRRPRRPAPRPGRGRPGK